MGIEDKLIEKIIENVNKYDKGFLKAQLRKLYLIGLSKGQVEEQEFIKGAYKANCLEKYIKSIMEEDNV